MSVIQMTTTTTSSTTSRPLLESSVSTLPVTVSEADESLHSTVSSTVIYMFSASMAPLRSTPKEEEELITTVAPTIRDEHEESDHTTAAPEVDLKYTADITDKTASVSETTEEPDDHSVIQIITLQPDVPFTDASVGTEPMFAEGKTEETVLGVEVTTAIISDLSDSPTESTDQQTIQGVFSSSESTDSLTELHSTTTFPDYDPSVDDIEIIFAVEGTPPTHPPQRVISSPDITGTIDGTRIPTTIPPSTFMCNTRPGEESHPKEPLGMATTTTQSQDVGTSVDKQESTAAILTEGGTSAEDVKSSTSVFDESTYQVPEHSSSSSNQTEVNTVTEIEPEFFTSAPQSSSMAHKTTKPGKVAVDELVQVSTVKQMQNLTGN